MEKIKQSKIAGSFYPKDKDELTNLISTFKNSIQPQNFFTRALIVPHAGLIYSGNLAFQGLNLLDRNIKSLFIFAPCHKVAIEGIATSSYDGFETPLGNVEIDKNTIDELKEQFDLKINDEALEFEHAIEVQLPLIQTIFDNLKVIPILVGKQDYTLISDIIEKYYDNKDYGFVISSDLSHFLADAEAKKLDNKTANMIESNSIQGFRFEQACGAVSIAGLVNFVSKKKFSLIRIGMINSSIVTSDLKSVVGYGAWALYEGNRNEFLDKFYHDFILDIAKKAIQTQDGRLDKVIPAAFLSEGACFVTLEKEGKLRGCIGSIVAHRPLIIDLVTNARNAAFFDPRFKPVEQDEINELQFAVSILSMPTKMEFSSEEDLLNKIEKDKDGLIIKDKGMQAVYLPSVWEQLKDKKEFLNSLKLKAGLPIDHFSDTFEAYKFYTTYIK